ncbi:hypothetical protein GCM10022245_39860 [Streptomyces mayteni]
MPSCALQLLAWRPADRQPLGWGRVDDESVRAVRRAPLRAIAKGPLTETQLADVDLVLGR